jgi:uncharacterized glyoxalase superfamily protein PhnB
MKPETSTPAGWPRISACVFYAEPRAAIDWLCRAFGFEVRLLVEGPGGRVEHSELEYGDGLLMVAGTAPGPNKTEPWRQAFASPRHLDGRMTQNLCVHVDDADAHCAAARAAGARVVYEPTTTDYGADYWADRCYAAHDPEGHLWWFLQRVSTGGKAHGR